MLSQRCFGILVLFLCCSVALSAQNGGGAQARLSEQILASAQVYLSDDSIPAYAAAVLRCGRNDFRSAGRIRLDRRMPVSAESKFNIGANAKAMLAAIAARYVEQGRIRFDSSIAELWPAAGEIAPDKASITLEMLLSHRSGLPPFISPEERKQIPEFSGQPADIRRQAAMWLLKRPLLHEPGETTQYSDAGYIVAGVLLARASGLSLEEMFETQVFAPLGLDARLGPSQSADEPFGHHLRDGRIRVNLDVEPVVPTYADAAGNVTISAPDYAIFLQANLCGLQGIETGYLSAATIRRLHAPLAGSRSALGWSRAEIAGAPTSFHVASADDFTAYAAIADGSDFGLLALLNVGGDAAAPGSSWLLAALAEAAREPAAGNTNSTTADTLE
jgi:CubicO group peptidase (beta-lactamase class C family)